MIRLERGPEIFELLVSRRVTEPELEDMKRQFETVISDGTDPRVLCCLTEFWGFDSQALWEDLRHWLRYLDRPARVALLAEPKWIGLFDEESLEPLTVEMRGFAPEQEAEARRWLRGSASGPPGPEPRGRPPARSARPRDPSRSLASS